MGKILPPSKITRTLRLLEDLKRFKASEFRNFLLHYSLVILKNLLPNAYYKNLSLLGYPITRVEDLYGEEFMKYNVHLLLHLPESVKNYGAMFPWSTLPYEDYNHTLRNMLYKS